jgi:hypothetical protein
MGGDAGERRSLQWLEIRASSQGVRQQQTSEPRYRNDVMYMKIAYGVARYDSAATAR